MSEYMRRPETEAKESAATRSRPNAQPAVTPIPETPEQRQAREEKIASLQAHWQAARPKSIAAAAQMTTERTSRPVRAQRQAIQPLFEAADLSRADKQHTQQAAQHLVMQRHALSESQAALHLNDLKPQPEHLLPRLAPRPEASTPYLTQEQRFYLAQSAENEISSALTANARYLPPAQRADLASAAIQRFKAQGLDPELLRAVMRQRAPDDATREAVGNAINAQRHTEIRQCQERTDHALLTHHAAVQRQFNDAQQEFAATQADLVARIEARRGSGQPLPQAVRQQLETGLNHDFSAVRVHTDSEADQLAKQLHATAFTSGKDIYFQSGQFDPTNKFELLIHEATHVKQQDSGQVAPGLDPNAGLEAEAKANETMLPQLAAVKAAESVVQTQATSAPQTTSAAQAAVQRKASPKPAPVNPAPINTETVPTVTEAVQALHHLTLSGANPKGGGLSSAQRAVQAMVERTAGHPAFWSQVADQGHERYGASFLHDALRALPEALQAALTLALLGGEQELTYEAFINQCSYMAYSNAPDLSDVKLMPKNGNNSTRESAQAILQAAGYRARPTINGLWGLQMRVFEPIPGQAKYHKTVVAFRGTEGIAVDFMSKASVAGLDASLVGNESELDTMADLAAYATAYSQYEANQRAIIDPFLKSLGADLVATGHSLGGGLAQIAAAKHAGQFSELLTFQSANISKQDVERLAKQNTALKARQFRVVGDKVPTSGEAAAQGEVVEVRRSAAGAGTQNLSFVGGHNAPVALELLREMALGNAIDKNNKLAQALIQHGSQDPVTPRGGEAGLMLNDRYPTAQDSTPGKEAEIKSVTGRLYIEQFINAYQNNAVYNILAEESFVRLGEIGDGLSPQRLVDRLLSTADRIIANPIHHTASSQLMLKVIFEKLEQEDKEKHKSDKVGIKLTEQRQSCESLDFDSEIINENKRRFKKNALDLWYSLNPEAEQLYLEARKLWLAES
ncbi:eCIS core domain-containing protein [Deinococcus sp.]|uniref:eCIS core domain-containing protein n=1 Tax=Deinococcus sp. TaxID=47478 RepID=UPI003B5C08CF